ncbi:MAG: DNA (cytosine-5-)-methyltransferase [Anaerolinea sp.]|nr:DNA (cytosine-5-)-methyltransferase [Anaerolinea sp.]
MKFIDLFAGLGGFNVALSKLGHECVFVSEIDNDLRDIYEKNFPESKDKIFGDIRNFRDLVPDHDILCAGFPCQPFSKSGFQLGLEDEIQGTLFYEIIHIIKKKFPQFLILENVGNFERHDQGRTWKIIKEELELLGYEVYGTEHVTSGGTGLISPQYFGFPHSRERFFIIGRLNAPLKKPFPDFDRNHISSLLDIIQDNNELSENDFLETTPTFQQIDCINHWGKLLQTLPNSINLPSFPIWGDEIYYKYPYKEHTPYQTPLEELRNCLKNEIDTKYMSKESIISYLPKYAQSQDDKFPDWKIDFINKNRNWFESISEYLSEEWINKLKTYPPSLRKLEWNCKGEERNIWSFVLQFRPSGLRVKRINSSPSLVAMTSTQIPLFGPKKRFLTRIEGLRLQGLPDTHILPISRDDAFKALGNGVHVGVVMAIAKNLLSEINK